MTSKAEEFKSQGNDLFQKVIMSRKSMFVSDTVIETYSPSPRVNRAKYKKLLRHIRWV